MPDEIAKTRNGEPLHGVLIGGAIGIATGLVGFALAAAGRHGNRGLAGMGATMFLVVPFASGFAIALVTRRGKRIAAAGILASVSSLLILIATGKEGVLCALLPFPCYLSGW